MYRDIYARARKYNIKAWYTYHKSVLKGLPKKIVLAELKKILSEDNITDDEYLLVKLAWGTQLGGESVR